MAVGAPLVKICGLTQVANALDCARAGADMIGLVFFKKSPRNVTVEQARKITRALPSHILPVGVFVDESYNTIMEISQKAGLGGAQLHGSEPPALAETLSASGLTVIKAFFAVRPPDLSMAGRYPAIDFCLAEYGKGILPGGNAESWDYNLTSSIDFPAPLMLAGGLTPANIAEAVSRATPGAVDASSGVESSPGIKDIPKVKALISAVKS
ncbi:MAG: phosphoribosylanthranilate isomerase [Desulfobacter sp.]|nr:MAG: phosphoribosylanthranilate isomerase [Desulfobacter sp.]